MTLDNGFSLDLIDPSNFADLTFNSATLNIEALTSSIDDIIIPEKLELYQNYPNPFNPVTNISFDVPTSGEVSVIIYDLKGSEVTTLVDSYLFAGSYSFTWNPEQMISSGVYIYQLRFDSSVINRKMLFMK